MPRRSKSVKRANRRVRRRTVHRRRHGGALSMNSALPYGDFEKGLGGGDLKQGQEFMKGTEAMHGGAALGGADFKDAFSGSPLLPADMAGAARTAALDASFKEIVGMKDMEGGRRRRRSSRKARSTRRKASRKAARSARRRASRKSRRASRKSRRASRKASRKSRRTMNMRKMRGGAAITYSPADFGAKEMLLDSYEGAGLNAEWKTAENATAYAPKTVDTYRPQ
jgi:hypothetical protein